MISFEQCLNSLVELAATDDPKSLVFVDRCVSDYLACSKDLKGAAHPCDDLAEALMKRAPDTELKGYILDKLFHVELKCE